MVQVPLSPKLGAAERVAHTEGAVYNNGLAAESDKLEQVLLGYITVLGSCGNGEGSLQVVKQTSQPIATIMLHAQHLDRETD